METAPDQPEEKLPEQGQAAPETLEQETSAKRIFQPEGEKILQDHEEVSKTTEAMIQAQVPDFKASSHEREHTITDLPEDKQVQIQQWVAIARTDPMKGIEAAKNSKDMALLDAFHGALTADKTFADMVKGGALKQLAE